MNICKGLISTALFSIWLVSGNTFAAGLSVVNGDGASEGFNDTTVVAAVGGNTATTLGAQRLAVFNKAAEILNSTFDIAVTVQINAQFNSLYCTVSSATLGSAGAANYTFIYDAGISNYRVYADALANQLQGADTFGGVEISAEFNSDLGNAGCMPGYGWYLGFDAPGGSLNSLLSVVLHEIMHGMGFLALINYDGSALASYGSADVWDPYTHNLYSGSQSALLPSLNQTQRGAAILSDTNLLWNGSQTNSQLSGLSAGVNGGRIQMFAPTVYESGSSVSHFDTDATPNELMEPYYTEFLDTPGLAKYLLADIGWTLSSANNAPVLASIGNQSMNEDATLTITLSATDADSDTLTYSLVSAPTDAGAVLSGSSLTFTPTANYHGSGSVSVQVSDGTDTDSETFTLTINSVNDAPLISAISDQTLNEDSTTSVTVSGSDVDGDSLTYSITSATASLGASISGTTLTFTPVANFNGSGTVTVQVSDGSLSASTVVNVTVNAVNDAPVFTSASSFSVANDDILTITLTATDIETASGSLIYSLAGFDSGAVSASVSGDQLTITPVSGVTGSTSVDVTVSDGSASTSATLTVTVLAAGNQAPVWNSLSAVSALENEDTTISLSASDPDGDTLTFSVESTPSSISASLSGSTLTVNGTTAGNYSLTLAVSDGLLSAQTTLAVVVYDAYELTTSGQSLADQQTVSAGTDTVSFTLSGGDNLLETSLFFGGSQRDDLLTYNASTGTYSLLMPSAGAFAGTYTLTITDSNGLTATYYFERPLRFTSNISPLLINQGAVQEVLIEGAEAGAVISLASDNGNLTFSDTNGNGITSVAAADNAAGFNPAVVVLDVSASQTAAFSATLTATAINVPDSATDLDFDVPVTLNILVQDSDGAPVEGADIFIDDTRFVFWNLTDSATTSSAGTVSMQVPPDALDLQISADGYTDSEVSVSANQSSVTITLISSGDSFTLSGIVQSSGFTFTSEAPLLTLTFSDASTQTLTTTAINASSVRYQWSGDLSIKTPTQLRVTHSKSDPVLAAVNTSFTSQTINVTMIQSSGQTTTVVVSAGSSGGGSTDCLFLILAGMLCLVKIRAIPLRKSGT